jgi:aspartate racemase
MKTIGLIGGMSWASSIERMVREGAESVILGCTEIWLLVKEVDSPVPVFDTAEIHAIAAVEYAMTPRNHF